MANETITIRVMYCRTDAAEHWLLYGVPEDYTVQKAIDFLEGLVAEGWTWSNKDDDRSKFTVSVEINADVHTQPDEVLLRRREVQKFYHPPEAMKLADVAEIIEAGPFKRIDNNQWPFNERKDN